MRMSIHTTHTRDAALRELGRLNRWLVSGSLVLTGVFADAAAHAFPGKKTKPASTTAPSSSARMHTHAKTSTTHPLQPPAQAPQATAESHSSTTQSAPAQESAPARESSPAQEPTPAHESVPSQEAAPAQESAPAQEAAPPTETAPTPEAEASAPVVSGGS
jgi:hypothetical protein